MLVAMKCSVLDCERTSQVIGLCRMHYRRHQRHGTTAARTRASAMERFESKIDRDGPVAKNRPDLGPCWIWRSGRFGSGYAQFHVDGRNVRAHRWAWEQANGPVPDGLVLDHFACDNGPGGCVNPAHVRPVTTAHNVSSLRRVNGVLRRWPGGCTKCGAPVSCKGLCARHYGRELYRSTRSRERASSPQ